MFGWGKKTKTKTNIEQSAPDRYHKLAIANRNKQRIIYSLLVICTFLVMILGYVSFKSNTRVYVVEKEGNNYTYFGYVNDLTSKVYNPDDNSLVFFLNNFIRKSRFLPTDLVLYKNNQKELGYFLNRKSSGKLDDVLTKDNYPEMINAEYAIDIQILSTLRVSPESFQIRWVEKLYDKAGKNVSNNQMVAFLRYEIKKPTSKEAILNNPLGIVITDLSMSEEK